MWRTLSNEAREAIGRLCEQHGRHLYDYCRTGLSPSGAELAVAGALLSAHAHRDRLRDRALLRPWLYALTRCHRAGVAASRTGSTGSWARPGAPDLVADALRALDAPHRELLDLSVRHELASAEIAAIFGVETITVNTMIAEAADRLEEWVAAVRAARTRDGCARLAIRMSDWAKAPGRRNRTRIARHIRSCPACQGAPREEARAGVLLLGLPLTAIPETLRDQPAWGDPLPSDPAAWRSDGFPAQARGLMEPPPALISLASGPTTETGDESWPAAGAAAAGQEHPAGSPEPDSPGRARRGASGTAEALLRAAHQTGERLVPTGPAPPDDSSGDTIPYRKRGDFPPMRIPPQRHAGPAKPARSAPPGFGSGRATPPHPDADEEANTPNHTALLPQNPDTPTPRTEINPLSKVGRKDTPTPHDETSPPPRKPKPERWNGAVPPGKGTGDKASPPPRKAKPERWSGAVLPEPGAEEKTSPPPRKAKPERWDGAVLPEPGAGDKASPPPRKAKPERWDGAVLPGSGAGDKASPPPRKAEPGRWDGAVLPGSGVVDQGSLPLPEARAELWGGDVSPGSGAGEEGGPPLREVTPERWGGGGLPGWRVRVPAPRRSDDPPRQHAPLRSLDPGWRSGRTPVTQYGDKLVFVPPADEGDGAPPDGGTWDEFWRERPDEDDPEARISLQWLVRAALIVGVVMLVAGLVWAGVEGRQRQAPATPGPGTSRPADADPWSSPVPADPGGTQAPGDLDATQAPADPDSTRAAAERAQAPTGREDTQTPDERTQATTGREDAQAPERAQAPTGREGARAPADAATEGRAGGARPPVAAISPASVQLGERRTGTFKLTCTGECRVTSFSGSNGIAVSGNAFTVRAPASRPGCAGPPVTESGVITVDWTGTLTDGGESVEADGTLTMMVSWTVTLDRGALIPDTDGGGHWSNCPQQKGTR